MRKMREFFAKYYGWVAASVVVIGGLFFSFKDSGSSKPKRRSTMIAKVEESTPHVQDIKHPDIKIGKREIASNPSKFEPFVKNESESEHQLKFDAEHCERIEFPGKIASQQITKPETWNKFMDEYHTVKDQLVSWIHKNKKYFGEKTAQTMEQNVKELKVSRPGVANEPDISVRGVGALSWDNQGEPIARMGAGYFDLLSTNPKRARFELTRLVAQVISPCEMQRLNAGKPWGELLKCMGIEDGNACQLGSISEEGWAVSSLVSTWIANPGCSIPAIKEPEIASCLKDFESYMKVTNKGHAKVTDKSAWMEARR